MSSRLWLLVEWLDEANVFPSYGIVNIDVTAYDDTDMQPGNETYIHLRRDTPRRAKILRISENKGYVQEQKDNLERQDEQVRNVLQICMRTLRELKYSNTLQLPCSSQYSLQQGSKNHVALPHVMATIHSDSDSGSDTEPEASRHVERAILERFNKSRSQYKKYGRKAPKPQSVRGTLSNAQTSRRPSMVSSTPLPSHLVQQSVKLCFDQGTQTEPYIPPPPLEKVLEMDAVIKMLYSKFQTMLHNANVYICNGSISTSDSEHNNDVSYMEASNAENHTDNEVNGNESGLVQDIEVEQVMEQNGGDQSLNSSTIEDRMNPNVLRVRRMSAQTTNNIETPPNDADLIPIGDGNTKVPARLLNEINWRSHTTATRQLLQAVFPRRVLATHSLTGKQSPAFMNKPPKKILDPKLVEDIVKIVSIRCGVPKSLVRNSITIKCTDEAKLYRNRLQFKLQRQVNGNDENRPPSMPSSDDSSSTVTN